MRRLCKLCRLNAIENEYNFLCVCPVYNSRREIVLEEVELKHVQFHTLSNEPKMAGYYLILYYCTLYEWHTCHLNQ